MPSLPVMAFAIVFGLSLDYEVVFASFIGGGRRVGWAPQAALVIMG